MVISLNDLKSQEIGVVAQIEGGRELVNRLEALGIRPGKKIKKISSMFMKGPVTVQVDRTQVAIGFGMARKILIDTERK